MAERFTFSEFFSHLFYEIVTHHAWFLYTLFVLRGLIYPLFGTSTYTLSAATLAGVLWTVLTPCSGTFESGIFGNNDHSKSPQHAYLTMPVTLSVYFFGGVWLTRLKLFGAAAAALLRYPWARLGVVLFFAAILTPCFLPPYKPVYDYVFPFNYTPGAVRYQPTGPWSLPVVILYVVCYAVLTPVSRLPMITSCGSRTLNGYLLLVHGDLLVAANVILEHLILPVFTNPDVANWIAVFTLVPLFTVLGTSELVAVAMWPITQPTWAVALLTGTETAPPPVAQRWASAAAGHMGSWTPSWWARFGEWAVFAPLFLFYTCCIAGMDIPNAQEQQMPLGWGDWLRRDAT